MPAGFALATRGQFDHFREELHRPFAVTDLLVGQRGLEDDVGIAPLAAQRPEVERLRPAVLARIAVLTGHRQHELLDHEPGSEVHRRLHRRRHSVAVAVGERLLGAGHEVGNGLFRVHAVLPHGLVIECAGLVHPPQGRVGVRDTQHAGDTRLLPHRETVLGERVLVVAAREGAIAPQARRPLAIVGAARARQRADPRQHGDKPSATARSARRFGPRMSLQL